MSKFKYTKEDVLREMAEALNETEPTKGTTAKPNVLEILKSKAGLNRTKQQT